MDMDMDFNKVVQTCEWLNEHFDLGNNKFDIEGRDVQEVTDALTAMNIAIGTLQSPTYNILVDVRIVLPKKERKAVAV